MNVANWKFGRGIIDKSPNLYEKTKRNFLERSQNHKNREMEGKAKTDEIGERPFYNGADMVNYSSNLCNGCREKYIHTLVFLCTEAAFPVRAFGDLFSHINDILSAFL